METVVVVRIGHAQQIAKNFDGHDVYGHSKRRELVASLYSITSPRILKGTVTEYKTQTL
jgi:hypothetical protein